MMIPKSLSLKNKTKNSQSSFQAHDSRELLSYKPFLSPTCRRKAESGCARLSLKLPTYQLTDDFPRRSVPHSANQWRPARASAPLLCTRLSGKQAGAPLLRESPPLRPALSGLAASFLSSSPRSAPLPQGQRPSARGRKDTRSSEEGT